MTKITSHKVLAEFIQGKKILHLNSFGKDSVVCLDWLHNFAKVKEIVSVHLKPFVPHPEDARYLRYLKNKFPRVQFIEEQNPHELTSVATGIFQHPDIKINCNSLRYNTFEMKDLIESIRVEQKCDYCCIGKSKYESFSRAVLFQKNGLVKGTDIYPIGLMTKKQIFNLLPRIKLHPVYKLIGHTLDTISYYKMRSTFKAYPEYYEEIKKYFPLIELDKFRYEVLFNGR